jgi:plastocyanin
MGRIPRVLVVSLMAISAACSGGQGKSAVGTTLRIAGQTIVSHGQIDVGGQTAEDVDVRNYYFDPTVLSGSGGQTLTITIHNAGTTTHNFSLPQQQIDQDVPVGQTAKVTVTFPANGEIVFFCRFHRSLGMLGALKAG